MPRAEAITSTMSAAPLIRQEEATPRAPRRTPWAPIVVAAAVAALVAAAVSWWFFAGRQAIPDWERLTVLDLAAPAGDAFADETPWVVLQLSPARPGEQNTLRLSLEAPRGSPLPATEAASRIEALTARPLAADVASAENLVLRPEPGPDGALAAITPLDRAGWWQFRVEVAGADRPAEFHLMLPDPNINGPNAVPGFPSSAEAEAVIQRGLAATAALQSVRYTQWNADGAGNSSVSEHAVAVGGDGGEPSLTFRITGGMEAVIIGSTRWVKLLGDLGWQRQEGGAFIPPSEWGEEYTEATGFTLLGEETIDGEPTQLVAFVAPEQTEPRRRTVAWYLWWVGTETGQVRREAMVSRQHYMLNRFSGFNEPMQILPPEDGGTPAANPSTPQASPLP